MFREIILTEDGSSSVTIPSSKLTYHSVHGAILESKHVFIDAGLRPLSGSMPILNIFEMGFGTGLNALLTLAVSEQYRQQIYYETTEPFPLEDELVSQLNYCGLLQNDLQNTF